MSAEWLCARCAKNENKETETDPVVLRMCTSCKIENWVRPFGHAGEHVNYTTGTPIEEAEVVVEAVSEEVSKLAEVDTEVAESIPEVEDPTKSVPYEPLEVEEEAQPDTAVEKPLEKLTKAELLAKIAELEK